MRLLLNHQYHLHSNHQHFVTNSQTDHHYVVKDPLQLDPGREIERGVSRSLVGFGAGPHRCAGEFIALAETDVFVRRLLALPGLRIESGPSVARNDAIGGYEVRKMLIAVD